MTAKRLTTAKDTLRLTKLGRAAAPGRTLETFPNHHRGRDTVITLVTDEFTTLGPVNRQPDFATLTVEYVPDRHIVESKSFKLYLQSFRNEETFYEHAVNVILDDLVAALKPRRCRVTAEYAVRGGIAMTVQTEWKKR